ncbi:hypothetical protein CR513_16158, partial [Mucuna pruriens]
MRSPYDMLYRKPPSYEHLRHQFIFVGYPQGQKGWQVYNPCTQDFLVLRDVRFYKNMFPYSQHKEGSSFTIFPDYKITRSSNQTTHKVSQGKPFFPSHNSFLLAIMSHDKSKTFSYAMKHPKWCEAMTQEIKALEENNTWTLEVLLEGKKLLRSRNFTKWMLVMFFLHGDLNEEVYMVVPPRYVVTNSKHVCLLRKSFAYHNLFTYSMGPILLVILVYVDDLVIDGNGAYACNGFKNYLSKCFHMKDLEKLKYFPGLELSLGTHAYSFTNTSTQQAF